MLVILYVTCNEYYECYEHNNIYFITYTLHKNIIGYTDENLASHFYQNVLEQKKTNVLILTVRAYFVFVRYLLKFPGNNIL